MSSPTEDQLVNLLSAVSESLSMLAREHVEVERVYAEHPDRIEALLSGVKFSWSELYEREFIQLVALFAVAIGFKDAIVKWASLSGAELHAKRLELLSGNGPDASIAKGVKPGHLMALMAAATRNLIAKQNYGFYIDELLRLARETDQDKWYLKAVRVDRSVVACPTFAERLARADLLGDQEFLGAVASAMKEPRKVWNFNRGQFKVALQLLRDLNALDGLTQESAYRILVERTGFYSGTGGQPADPASLWRTIQRWRSLIRTKSREEMSS